MRGETSSSSGSSSRDGGRASRAIRCYIIAELYDWNMCFRFIQIDKDILFNVFYPRVVLVRCCLAASFLTQGLREKPSARQILSEALRGNCWRQRLTHMKNWGFHYLHTFNMHTLGCDDP